MPLKPSGHTPTSSPPPSIRSASSLQARVAPLLRARLLTSGIRKTRSAPSGRRWRPVASWIVTIVIRPSIGSVPGVVGDDQGAALGRDVVGAADLDPEPLLGDRAERGHQEPLGDLGVEAVLVDDVVAGHAGGAGRPGTGPAGAPTARRRPPSRRTGTRPASRPPGCRPAAPGPRVVAAVARAARADSGVRLGGGGAAGAFFGGGACSRRGLRRRRLLGRAAAFFAGALGAGEVAGGRRRLVACRCRARAAPGADRDDLGVTHGRLRSAARCARPGTEGAGQAVERPDRAAAGRRRAVLPKSANASAVVYAGSKPSIVRIRVVSTPRP